MHVLPAITSGPRDDVANPVSGCSHSAEHGFASQSSQEEAHYLLAVILSVRGVMQQIVICALELNIVIVFLLGFTLLQ